MDGLFGIHRWQLFCIYPNLSIVMSYECILVHCKFVICSLPVCVSVSVCVCVSVCVWSNALLYGWQSWLRFLMVYSEKLLCTWMHRLALLCRITTQKPHSEVNGALYKCGLDNECFSFSNNNKLRNFDKHNVIHRLNVELSANKSATHLKPF